MGYKKNFALCIISISALALMVCAAPARAADKKAAPKPHIEKAAKPHAENLVKAAKQMAADEDASLAAIEKAQEQSPPLPLEAALVQAYDKNPVLEAARAQLRAVDETYAQAAAGFRPSLTGVANYQSVHDDGNLGVYQTDQKQLSLQLSQPLYSGGSTVAQMEASEKNIKAQRAALHATEQDILLQTVTAYMDVLRDRQIRGLNRYNEKVLSDRLKEARERFKLGDITKTDVSQAESRLAAASADAIAAQGTYRVSRARFEKVVGMEPEGLRKPDLKIDLPHDLDTALAAAETDNPNMKSATYASDAAKSNTRAVEGQLLPQVSVQATADKYYDPIYSPNDEQAGGSVMLQATVPLYAGGATYSRIRQSKQVESQRVLDISRTRRDVHQAVVDAWEQLAAARAGKDARAAQVRAARIALKGVQVETDYGSRTTLDLLDAEREYRDAQVAFASAERDQIVASYGLLAAEGRLTVSALGLKTAAYDPAKNFQKVKNKWIGTGIRGD